MDNKTTKAVFVNGGPRKKWNTFKMLESAMEGAREAGADVEMVNLYDIDEQGNRRRPINEKQTAMIFTMNIPEEAMEDWKYPTLLGTCEKQLRENFGHSETLYACNTYQFNDYSRYAVTYFSEEDKRRYRDEHFATDLQNAYELGQRLVVKAPKEE